MGGRGGLYRRIRLGDGHSKYVRKDADTEFHTFDDKPRSITSYHGDGLDQGDWFTENSNLLDQLRGMSEEDEEAFKLWSTGRFMDGRQYRGWDTMWDKDKAITQRLDDVLDKAVLHSGVTVVRLATAELLMGQGTKTAPLAKLQALEGSIVTSKGNMATAAASQGLTIGVSKKHEYRIHIPGGTTGAGMYMGTPRLSTWGDEQREFIMNRDTAFRVGKTTYDATRRVYITDLTYVGRQAHDYGKSGRLSPEELNAL